MSITRTENQKKWREHVAKAQEHGDGFASYCRVNGISNSTLVYWRKKLGPKPASELRQGSPFIPVQVLNVESMPRGSTLPDAKWVAEVILHLSAGISRSNR